MSTAKKIISLTTFVILFLTSNLSAKPLSLETINVVPIVDNKTERAYELYIKLPEGYDKATGTKYPVIYFTDAMWHVELLSSMTEYMLEPVILVGISWQKNANDLDAEMRLEEGEYISRFRDYSFSESNNTQRQAKYRFGEANKHLAFISDQVIDYVERTYRTQPNNRTYFGYSLGGTFGAYILMTQPDIFNTYLLGSPGLERLADLEEEGKLVTGPLNANVFLGHGTLDSEISNAQHIYRFIKFLDQRNDSTLSIKLAVVEGNHSTAFPSIGLESISWLSHLQKKGESQ